MKLLTTCAGIIVNDAGHMLILRRSDTDKHRPLQWDLPGGHVELDETFKDAVRREILEESGQDIDVSKLQLVYGTSGTYPGVGVRWLFFIGKASGSEVALSYEHDEFRWTSIDEAIELVGYAPKHRALTYIRDNGLLHV